MLLSCSFDNRPCNISRDFIRFSSQKYGNCFTFNARRKHIDQLKQITDGFAPAKLVLDIYLHEHQYTSHVHKVGLVALVHHYSEWPVVDRQALWFRPGESHRIGFSKKLTKYLLPPYTACTFKLADDLQEVFDAHQVDFDYSQDFCEYICTEREIISRCNCTRPGSMLSYLTLNSTLKFCDTLESTQCVSNATQQVKCQHCVQPCTVIQYLVHLTSARFPSSKYLQTAKSNVERVFKQHNITLDPNWSSEWKQIIEQNYVQVEVALEMYNVETIQQDVSQSWQQLVADYGGLCGLFIGVSLLSLVELLELIYRLTKHACRSKLQTYSDGMFRRPNAVTVQTISAL
ncbi:unnamed protein product [Didymodactylos carnosus]|uniref:Amiloride-sensitive sodium channel n=1 Tax=Didymodactylos carnosus TaxID=1234261 RepID=A0A815CQF9_9BILA|nr:unnamed protein product [Didymodactylos carnosus]CAF1285998.1 unnamed protein product [Didymodactylos carnosus]CAF3802463.1 unnamed protein product [Didymodactylos carnosus]CAF4086376.1 unnamed protein product [Didymodactylos carnosus]